MSLFVRVYVCYVSSWSVLVWGIVSSACVFLSVMVGGASGYSYPLFFYYDWVYAVATSVKPSIFSVR